MATKTLYSIWWWWWYYGTNQPKKNTISNMDVPIGICCCCCCCWFHFNFNSKNKSQILLAYRNKKCIIFWRQFFVCLFGKETIAKQFRFIIHILTGSRSFFSRQIINVPNKQTKKKIRVNKWTKTEKMSNTVNNNGKQQQQ